MPILPCTRLTRIRRLIQPDRCITMPRRLLVELKLINNPVFVVVRNCYAIVRQIDRLTCGSISGVPSGANPGGPYANPYDAALFNAAATMYMNQNPRASGKTGGANFGSSAGATAAATNFKQRPGFRNAKFRSMRPPKPQQLHYCDACKISCAGPSVRFSTSRDYGNYTAKVSSRCCSRSRVPYLRFMN